MNAEPLTCDVCGELRNLEMEHDKPVCENCLEQASPHARVPLYTSHCPVFRVVMEPHFWGGMR